MNKIVRISGLLLPLAISTSAVVAGTISGTVFEDKQYGGGAGAAYSNGNLTGSSGRSGVRVELYRANGAFEQAVTTNASGLYTFSNVGNAAGDMDYIVRVVSNDVTSSRAFNAGFTATNTSLLAVPVYRATGASGTAAADVDYVGGEDPLKVDAGDGSNTSAANDLAALTTATTIALVQTPVNNVDTSDNITGLNFGFSFDVVTNRNDAGQGSLRQFILNANALSNTALDQRANNGVANAFSYDPAAGVETAIFMIPNGGEQPGIRAGVASQLTGSAGSARALITLLSALPPITDANTVLDGTTQTKNVRVTGSDRNNSTDTNAGQLGRGGTVGSQQVAFVKTNRPEIEISVPATLTGLTFAANNSTLRGVALHGGAISLSVTAGVTGFTLEESLIGIDALTLTTPATNPTSNLNVQLLNATGTIRNNIIGYAGSSNINYSAGAGSAGYLITQNELVQAGRTTAGGDNLSVGDQGAAGPLTITENLIRDSNSSGIQFEIGSIRNNLVENNTIEGNGKGGTSSRLEGSGIHYLLRADGITSSNTDVLRYNVIRSNQSSGIVLNYGQRNVQITQNSIYGNGDGTTGGKGLIAIDFTPASYRVGGNAAYGQGDGVTGNDGTLDLARPNGGMNYPIITKKNVTTLGANTVLHVEGFVGRRSGQTEFANTVIEFYRGDNDTDTNQNGVIFVGDGQSFPHGEPRDYIGSLTTTTTGSFNADITVRTTDLSPALRTTDPINSLAFKAGYGTSEAGINLIPNTIPAGALPVSLTDFSATCTPTGVMWIWHTASEHNNRGFEVQQLVAGNRFETIAFQAGAGTSSQPHTYQVHNALAATELGYYRLRQLDEDGTESYSPVVAVHCRPALTTPAALELFPNPAHHTVTVLGAVAGELQLLDLTGRVLRQQATLAPSFDLTGVAPGLYLIRSGTLATRLNVE